MKPETKAVRLEKFNAHEPSLEDATRLIMRWKVRIYCGAAISGFVMDFGAFQDCKETKKIATSFRR